ncbi:Cysteine proteinase 3 [Entamoeba marina]
MFALLAFALLSNAITFEQWSARHNMKYSAVEALRRRAIFNINAKIVADHNTDAKFQLSLDGPFAAMTNSEYNALLRSFELAPETKQETIKGDVPDAVDWRAEGKITPIRDQGQCGSCYSFSSLAALEGRLLIAGSQFTVDNLDLSEQQIVDCSDKNNGCDGGSLVYVYLYTKSNGVMQESDYAYTEVAGECQYDESKVVAKNTGYKTVQSRSESALTEALVDGPVAVAIDASHISFQLYKSGVYDEPKCKSLVLNHGVTAVGYGTLDGTDYYIVKNSWGTAWGDEGYILMSRNNNNQCGIASGAVYPTGVQDA